MLTNHKELKELLKQAEKRGWTFKKGRKHIKGRHPTLGTTVVSVSPSSNRTLDNVKKYLGLL